MFGEDKKRPKVGLGVMIFKDGKVLLGKRKGSHGEGDYAFPGGHLEYMEGFGECVKRETLEEAGIEIKNVWFLGIDNVTKYAPKHYVNIELIADWESGEPKICEPDKFESWDWYDLNNLPKPLFEFVVYAIDSYKTGKNYYDKE
jgi:8-oxo-dGTP diphosphatase